jgi:hypothetical protein
MGIETLVPVFAALVIFLIWRAFHRKADRADGTPTDPHAPKGDTR